MRDRRKQSVYFPERILQELEAEAALYGVTVSKLLQDAWDISKHWADWPEKGSKPTRPLGTVLFLREELSND